MQESTQRREFYRVEAPHFVAGVEAENDIVTRVPPILRWALGKPLPHVLDYFRRRNYKVQTINPESTKAPE